MQILQSYLGKKLSAILRPQYVPFKERKLRRFVHFAA